MKNSLLILIVGMAFNQIALAERCEVTSSPSDPKQTAQTLCTNPSDASPGPMYLMDAPSYFSDKGYMQSEQSTANKLIFFKGEDLTAAKPTAQETAPHSFQVDECQTSLHKR